MTVGDLVFEMFLMNLAHEIVSVFHFVFSKFCIMVKLHRINLVLITKHEYQKLIPNIFLVLKDTLDIYYLKYSFM